MAKAPDSFLPRVKRIAREDGRYSPAAFVFVSDAIGRTVAWIKDGTLAPLEPEEARSAGGTETFHVSGRELLEGFRRLAREHWGCMARHVLAAWGVRRTEDVGEIVFLMVEDPELGWSKRDRDSREDFSDGYDFAEAFDNWREAEGEAE